MIATLEFEAIDLERQRQYNILLSFCSQKASDYSFINIWGWADEYGLKWAWDDRNQLVWISQEYPASCLWAPVGAWQKVDWQKVLPSLRGSVPLTFHRVPEELALIWKDLKPEGLEVIADRGQWDYLYLRQELVDLKGKRFHKKKNLLNQFRRKYAYHYLDLGPQMIELALEMQDKWCLWKDCEAHQILAAENRVITRVLQNWTALDRICGGALEVEGILAAYTIAEKVSHDTMVIHFEKGDPSFKGSYQAINQSFLASCNDEIKWVNREQDLGNDGLRKAKLSYNPAGYIRKYKVMLK